MEKSKEWTVADLLQLSGGYWGTCALHAAVALDLFSPLAEQARSTEELSKILSLDNRGAAMLLDALTALNLVEKQSEEYRLTPFSEAYLNKSSESYIGHIINHHHHLMSGWSQLHKSVKSGKPVRVGSSHVEDEKERESFLMGMFNLASQIAPAVARSIDLKGKKRLLDLGGGPGTYAIHFCLNNPDMKAVVFDLPTTRKFAEATIERFLLGDRIFFNPGNFHIDQIPEGFDVAWLSQILHSDGPKECASLLEKTCSALNPGGLIFIQEFILDDSKDAPLFPALFSLNMLVGTEKGRSYSDSELRVMLESAGFTDIKRVQIDLPNGAGIISGKKH